MEFSEQSEARTPSPLRLANAVHFALGVLSCSLGAWVLFGSREALRALDTNPLGVLGLGVAIFLLLYGGVHVALSMTYWSFGSTRHGEGYLGAAKTSNEKEDKRRSYHYVNDILKNGMTSVAAYPGPIGGALDSLVPRLVNAPPPVRHHAYLQMLRTIRLAVILVGLSVGWVMSPPEIFPWVALVFFLMALASTKPMETARLIKQGRVDTETGKPVAVPSWKSSVAFLVLIALAPIVVPLLEPFGLGHAPFEASAFAGPTLLILLPSLVGSLLYFFALLRQGRGLTLTQVRNQRVDAPTTDESGAFLDKAHRFAADASAGSPPVEIARWFSANTSKVEGGLLVEGGLRTDGQRSGAGWGDTLRQAWGDPMRRPLVILEGVGLLLGIVGLVYLAVWGLGSSGFTLTGVATGGGLVAAAQFCLVSAHRLWRRADFRSRVFRFEYFSILKRVSLEMGTDGAKNGKITDTGIRAVDGEIACAVVAVSSVSYSSHDTRFITSVDLDVAATNAMLEELQLHERRRQERIRGYDQQDGARQQSLCGAAQSSGLLQNQVKESGPAAGEAIHPDAEEA